MIPNLKKRASCPLKKNLTPPTLPTLYGKGMSPVGIYASVLRIICPPNPKPETESAKHQENGDTLQTSTASSIRGMRIEKR